MTDENIIEGPWEGGEGEMTEEEYNSAMQELLATADGERIGMIVGGSLELLTMNALDHGSFYLESDDQTAITVVAVNDSAAALKDAMPDTIKPWDELIADSFETNRDPGDEQDEPATESE